MVSGLSSVIFISLYRAWHFYHVPIISLGSFQYCKIWPKLSNRVLAPEDQVEPGYLIRWIRTVSRQYKKCTSSLTGVITSLTDLLQANCQGLIRHIKFKFYRLPCPAQNALLFKFLFYACQIFFPSLPLACSQARYCSQLARCQFTQTKIPFSQTETSKMNM